MRLVEIVWAFAELSPGRDQLPILRELPHAGNRSFPRRVPLRDVNLAVRRDEHVVRLIEEAGIGTTRSASGAERHEQLAVRTELVDLMPRRRIRWRRVAAKRAGAVGNPDVAVAVD